MEGRPETPSRNRRVEGAGPVRNPDVEAPLRGLAQGVSFEWLRAAVEKTGRLIHSLRRNIQKNIALDSLVLELRLLKG